MQSQKYMLSGPLQKTPANCCYRDHVMGGSTEAQKGYLLASNTGSREGSQTRQRELGAWLGADLTASQAAWAPKGVGACERLHLGGDGSRGRVPRRGGCDFTRVLRGPLWPMAGSRWMRENMVQARGTGACTRVGFPLGLIPPHLLWSCWCLLPGSSFSGLLVSPLPPGFQFLHLSLPFPGPGP